MISASFDSTKTSLQELLDRADSGRLQLPDFQRGWVWDEERIRSLLASVSESFPIGAVMLLETGGEHVRFKPRPLTGTLEAIQGIVPEMLILDGQQRLTSLYQALMGTNPVETKDNKNKPIRRWYYLDMAKAVADNGDREDAVISVPENKIAKAFGGDIVVDVSANASEYELGLFPVNCIFHSADWRQSYNKYWNYASDKIQLYDRFEHEVIKRFEQYHLPVIELRRQTPKEAVCLVFERVNTGGVPLNVFELLTASFAADNYQLREDWAARQRRLKGQYPVLDKLQNDDFLQAISLLVTQTRRHQAMASGVPAESLPGISCKRKDILKLEVDDWKKWADHVEKGFGQAARFLHTQKIFRARDMPYRTQIVPLAVILAVLNVDSEPEVARQKIARWFWCGVLGELYGSAIETRFARDLPEVVALVRSGGAEPQTMHVSTFQANRLVTLRSRNSSAYKGIHALLMRDGGRDFRTGDPIEAQTFFDDSIDIHHIFPEKWCKTQGIDRKTYNSIINKTAIAARTNRRIGGNAPSVYLQIMETKDKMTPGKLDEILRSHCVEPCHLRANDFWAFYAARAEMLLSRIETATGKTIAREPGLFAADTTAGSDDEDEEDIEDGETGGFDNAPDSVGD